MAVASATIHARGGAAMPLATPTIVAAAWRCTGCEVGRGLRDPDGGPVARVARPRRLLVAADRELADDEQPAEQHDDQGEREHAHRDEQAQEPQP